MMNIARLPVLLTGLALSAVLLIFTLFVLIWQADAAKQWVTHTVSVQLLTEQLMGSLRDAETGQRGYLLTSEKALLAPYVTALLEWPAQLSNLRKLTRDNAVQQSRVVEISGLMRQKFVELDEGIKLAMVGDHSAAIDQLRLGGKDAMGQIRAIEGAMVDEEAALLIKRQANADWLIKLVLGACVAIAATILGLGISVFRQLAAEVDQLESVVADRTRHLSIVTVELVHCSKNQLALVQSIANQTARNNPSSAVFLEKFRARLQALGRSINELTRQNWRVANLENLLRAELEWLPTSITRDRIGIEGVDVWLSPFASHYFGLALHELLTNAVKHGALSNDAGRVQVRWSLVAEADPSEAFQFVWSETGGPPSTGEPAREGFGWIILNKLTPASLKGHSNFEYVPAGLRWTLLAPAPVEPGEFETKQAIKLTDEKAAA